MQNSDSNFLNTLNAEQKKAVTNNAQQLLVLAGAGSGKTKVLTHRIAWLLQNHLAAPDNILAVTFTNKAAAEMRHRIEQLTHQPLYQMWVGTFHGLSHRFLRQHAQEVGLSAEFQIMDSQDQLSIIKRIHKELALDEKRWQPSHSQWFINNNKDEGIRSYQLRDTGNIYNKTLQEIYSTYEQYCQRSGLVDFAELILLSCELLQKNPVIAEHYNRRFQYILVDEFQDTNGIQYHWIQALAKNTSSLTIVGDDDQSIYGWRGARIENIEQLRRDYPHIAIIKLEQNYRSTHTILEAANHLISNNLGRLGKNLWTESNKGKAIQLYSAYNEYDEAKYIISHIKRQFEQGSNYREHAILYRSNAQSRIFEEALLQINIPYRIYGGQRFYERLEIKNILAYLKLVQNTGDDSSFERIINVPHRGIGEKSLQNIRDKAKQNQLTLYQAAIKLMIDQELSERSSQAIAGFIQLINQLQAKLAEHPHTLAAFVEHIIQITQLAEHHLKEKGEKGETRLDNLNEFINAVSQFEKSENLNHAHASTELLNLFLAQVSLDAGDRQAEDYSDAVQLMTLHSAKGLEFPYVFLAGLEEGLFPHVMSADDPKKLEEERRLCYVGITRAMNELFMSYAETRRVRGKETYNSKSRFINEIPESCFEMVRAQHTSRPSYKMQNKYHENSADYGASSFFSETIANQRSYNPPKNNFRAFQKFNDSANGFHVGQRIKHKIFGLGTIINSEGQGESARIQVNFDREGIKWLITSYAGLEKV